MSISLLKDINRKVFWINLIVSIGLIVGGFFVPPLGVIDGSVLTAVGLLFLFPVLATVNTAIEKGSDITIKKDDLEVKIDNPDQSD